MEWIWWNETITVNNNKFQYLEVKTRSSTSAVHTWPGARNSPKWVKPNPNSYINGSISNEIIVITRYDCARKRSTQVPSRTPNINRDGILSLETKFHWNRTKLKFSPISKAAILKTAAILKIFKCSLRSPCSSLPVYQIGGGLNDLLIFKNFSSFNFNKLQILEAAILKMEAMLKILKCGLRSPYSSLSWYKVSGRFNNPLIFKNFFIFNFRNFYVWRPFFEKMAAFWKFSISPLDSACLGYLKYRVS